MKLNKRFLSLDVFRGMDVALMIVVNSLGSQNTYSPLLHADWDGFTLTDLVFPTFLFVVGNAMSFSQPKYEALGEGAFLKKVLIRSVVIFLLGFLMYWFPFFRMHNGAWEFIPFSDTRVFGVLQRIALCYLFVSLLIHYAGLRGSMIFGGLALIAYNFLLISFGDLTLEGNAVVKFDTWLIGTGHLYMGEGVPFDPEGLLSTLPSMVNVIAGFAAGHYLQQKGQTYETIAKMLLIGCALLFFALSWDLIFPINKKLWTSSYVLLTVGIDFIILSFLVYLIEIAKFNRWTYFFEVFGRNTLFIYIVSELIVITMFTLGVGNLSLYKWVFVTWYQPWAGDLNGSPLFAISIMLICWSIGFAMDKLKIYVRV